MGCLEECLLIMIVDWNSKFEYDEKVEMEWFLRIFEWMERECL